jgi:Contractile injection system tube protein/LysM domain
MTAVANASFERLPNAGASEGEGIQLDVQFNPTEFSLTKGAQLAEIPIPGLDQPIIQFVRGQTETLSLELFFDSTEDGTGSQAKSVTEKTDDFYSLIKIDPETHAPPVLLFKWGSEFPGYREVFKCVVSSVRQHFTMFSPTGVPLRAKLTVELREYKTLPEQIYELNLQSADQTKAHVVLEGETLSSIAYQAYGDPSGWRRIADANAIEDPLALAPATILRVPRGAR